MNIMLHGRTTKCLLNWDNVCAVSDYHDGDYNSLVTTNGGEQTKVVETVDDIAAMVGYALRVAHAGS